jgi:hypothetical protein
MMSAGLVVMLAALSTARGGNNEGFIYGKITTREGDTYTGTMRWGTQECFWDDIFNATKEDNPWLKYADRDDRKRRREWRDDNGVRIKILGIDIHDGFGWAGAHMFICRFGDIESIETKRGDRAILKMKGGSEFEPEGYGDIQEKIQIVDRALGRLKLDWEEIRTIEFMPTPDNVKVEGYRLKGKVKARGLELSGYIMWDAEECLSTDILDGEDRHRDLEIEFGNVRSIERLSSRSCRVKLKDGREFDLSGTNDVNDENRNIFVEDERYGKVEIGWNDFDQVQFEDEGDSGKPYGAYPAQGRIRGTVETVDRESYAGEIVFDLDESEAFEMLNGDIGDVSFNIPFYMVAAITPRSGHASMVKMIGGEELRLEEAQDVTDDNDGVLIFQNDKKETYVTWDEIETITFER